MTAGPWRSCGTPPAVHGSALGPTKLVEAFFKGPLVERMRFSLRSIYKYIIHRLKMNVIMYIYIYILEYGKIYDRLYNQLSSCRHGMDVSSVAFSFELLNRNHAYIILHLVTTKVSMDRLEGFF